MTVHWRNPSTSRFRRSTQSDRAVHSGDAGGGVPQVKRDGGLLLVRVCRGKNLGRDALGSLYTVCDVEVEGHKKTTPMKHNHAEPVWNHALVFNVTEFYAQAPITLRVRSAAALKRSVERGEAVIPMSDALPARYRIDPPKPMPAPESSTPTGSDARAASSGMPSARPRRRVSLFGGWRTGTDSPTGSTHSSPASTATSGSAMSSFRASLTRTHSLGRGSRRNLLSGDDGGESDNTDTGDAAATAARRQARQDRVVRFCVDGQRHEGAAWARSAKTGARRGGGSGGGGGDEERKIGSRDDRRSGAESKSATGEGPVDGIDVGHDAVPVPGGGHVSRAVAEAAEAAARGGAAADAGGDHYVDDDDGTHMRGAAAPATPRLIGAGALPPKSWLSAGSDGREPVRRRQSSNHESTSSQSSSNAHGVTSATRQPTFPGLRCHRQWYPLRGNKLGQVLLELLYVPMREIKSLLPVRSSGDAALGPDAHVPGPDGVTDAEDIAASEDGWTALHRAAADNDPVMLQALAKAAAPAGHLYRRTIDEAGMTALDIACARGHAGNVATILGLREPGKTTSPASQRSSLHYAALTGKTDVVAKVATALVRAQQATHRRMLARRRRAEQAAAVTMDDGPLPPLPPDAGSPLDMRDANGYTPVALAAAEGHTAVVQLLARKGADVGAANAYSDTPLLLAIAHGHAETAAKLLQMAHSASQYGMAKQWPARPVVPNVAGVTPLIAATRRGEARLVRTLVEIGVPRAASTRTGETALHAAARLGREDLVRLLALADVSVRAKAAAMAAMGRGKSPSASSGAVSLGASASSSSAGGGSGASGAGSSGGGTLGAEGTGGTGAGAKADSAPSSVWRAVRHGIGDDGRGRFFHKVSEPVDVLVVDAQGRTPLSEARQGTTPGHRAVAALLERLEAGQRARVAAAAESVASAELKASSMRRPIPTPTPTPPVAENGGCESDVADDDDDYEYESAIEFSDESDSDDGEAGDGAAVAVGDVAVDVGGAAAPAAE